jgi:hypothetical protein
LARVFSKAVDVATVAPLVLDTPAARRHHFDAREGHTYAMHLYLDYQDGQWPEVHTVQFSPGSHDWEEKSLRVEPTRPVKTAMILLEFHQPQGAAWFDDVSLASGSAPDLNLLAASGFEEDDPQAVAASEISAEYEQRVQTLLTMLAAAATSSDPVPSLAALNAQTKALADWVSGQGLAAHFPRELRDLDDIRESVEICARLLAAP